MGFNLFKKKLSDEDLIKANLESRQAEVETSSSDKKQDDLGDSKLGVEVIKIKAQLEGLNEQRQAVNDRFGRLNESIGEMRGMIMDTNKAVGNIEASATKAIDLVENVKPDLLMVEIRKQDSKLESLKANLESNESLMKDLMSEVKEMRKRMDFYKGVEQVVKMNNEIKDELIQIKKIEGNIDRHSNKVETIFLEVEKKFTEFDKYGDTAKDLQRNFDKIQGDVDKLRVKVEDKSDKKEVMTFVTKFNDFEKHTTNIINLLDERSKTSIDEIKKTFDKVVEDTRERLDSAIRQLGLEAEKVGKEVPKELKPKRSWRDLFQKKKSSEEIVSEAKENVPDKKEEEPEVAKEEPTKEPKPETKEESVENTNQTQEETKITEEKVEEDTQEKK
jgi:chromosome segregation ATPase